MEIKRIPHQDLQALLALYQDLHEKDDPPPNPLLIEEVWRTMQHGSWFHPLGLYEDDTLCSSCCLCVIPNLTRGCRPYGLIENVVTARSFRRRGFGKALLQHAVHYGLTQGCYKIMLLTGRKDEAVRAFYLSAGFDPDTKQAYCISSREPAAPGPGEMA